MMNSGNCKKQFCNCNSHIVKCKLIYDKEICICKTWRNNLLIFLRWAEKASIYYRSIDQCTSSLSSYSSKVELCHNLKELKKNPHKTTNPQCFVFDLNGIAFKCSSCWTFLAWMGVWFSWFSIFLRGTAEIRAVITGTLNQMQPFSLGFRVGDERHCMHMFP